MKLKITTHSSLAKVYEDQIYGKEIDSVICAKNKDTDFQIALLGKGEYTFEIESDLVGIKANKIGLVKVDFPTAQCCMDDPHYQRYTPGMYPDPVIPLKENKITLEKKKYTSIWLEIPKQEKASESKICVKFYKKGRFKGQACVNVRICDVELPEQELKFTQWFHCDCIASYHDTPTFGVAHWYLIEKYIALATKHGMNMILTPVLTPPLDTEVGCERPTTQLVSIKKNGDVYEFDTSDLECFVEIARKNGIKYFEISHFFTQWGAKHAPKVIAEVDGEEKRIFGWETDATSEEYTAFLRAFIPTIINCLTDMGVEKENIYFHISDEPGEADLEQYLKLSAVVLPLIEGCNQIDALSNINFYNTGAVKIPVVGTTDLEPFFEAGVEGLWCYYCCAQGRDVANRFIAMPSERGRIIGTQMYLYNIKGFLQWGYNFYYTRLSKSFELDPYEDTSAGYGFPSGDAFSVYPVDDGAIPSIRQKVFRDAIDDIRLLSLAEERLGRETVEKIVKAHAEMEMTFKKYPHNEEFFEDLTAELYERLENK